MIQISDLLPVQTPADTVSATFLRLQDDIEQPPDPYIAKIKGAFGYDKSGIEILI